jgi:pseudouridine kinase
MSTKRKENGKNILGVGGANMDVHLKISGDYVLHDSNPGRLLLSPGGVTRNILDNLAKLGLCCSMLTAVGKDVFGDEILRSCSAAGIKTDHVFRSGEEYSSSYIALIDGEGDMFVGACDAEILEHMPLSYIEAAEAELKDADAIVCDTNLTEEQLTRLTELAGNTPVFIDPVSTAKAKRIKDIAGRFYCIKPNRMELEAITGMECLTDRDIETACEKLLREGVREVAVSLGERGCYFADSEGHSFFRTPAEVEEMVNASGAGDAFTAGLVYSYIKGLSPEETVDTALRCGSIAVMSGETINPSMSEELLKAE